MIDWSRVIKEKIFVGKNYLERVVYRDEARSCEGCPHFELKANGDGRCDVFKNKTWKRYFKACVQYDDSNN